MKDKIKINEVEYAALISTEYLEKLEKIYFVNNFYKKTNLKIVGIQEFNFKDLSKIINVTSN